MSVSTVGMKKFVEPVVDFYAQVTEENCIGNIFHAIDPSIRNYTLFSDEDAMGIHLSDYKVPVVTPENIPHYGETWEIILTKTEGEGDFLLYSISTDTNMEAFTINKLFKFDTGREGNGVLELYMDAGAVEGKEDLLGEDLRVGNYYNLALKKVNIEIEDLTGDEE